MKEKDFKPALATDQTSAHDPLYGYVPLGYTIEEVELARKEQPKKVRLDAEKSIAQHWEAMLKLHARGIPCFDYGNNIRAVAESQGVDEAFQLKVSYRSTYVPYLKKEKALLDLLVFQGIAKILS